MKPNPEETAAPPIEVDASLISDDARESLIESFILREGTDYGAQEISLETKKQQVRRQLEKEDIKIIFDPSTESVTLMTIGVWEKLQKRTSN